METDQQFAFEEAIKRVIDEDETGVNTAFLMLVSTHCDVQSRILHQLERLNKSIETQNEVLKMR